MRRLLAAIAGLALWASAARAETYAYDAQGRVTRVTYDDGTFIAYTYDKNGNIVAQTAQGKPQGNTTPPPAQKSGCGCTTAGLGDLAPAVLALLLARPRRRRRPRAA